MHREKKIFENGKGEKLVAYIELPIGSRPHNFAIFAHCFTCNKNFQAVRNISLALTQQGFGVLSFDFTGLGESEGEFADTNFTTNVDDLIAAADFLEANYQSPTLIIGHSLGGAAAVFAASKINSIQALVAIGAPADPTHVQHLLKDKKEDIEANGKAKVNIGGRDFMVKKQFLDDLEDHSLEKVLKKLRKSILIAHSPQDKIVDIKNAAQLYEAAHHPKSFISLDGADHLLGNKKDSLYLGSLIATWSRRYLDYGAEEGPDSDHQAAAVLGDSAEKFLTQVKAGTHFLLADEPESVGGNSAGPTPYDLLAASLATCKAMTLRMYADRKKWNLNNVEVHVDHGKRHCDDCANVEEAGSKIDSFDCFIKLEGELDESQKKRLLEIADKCPVHKTLHSKVSVKTSLMEDK